MRAVSRLGHELRTPLTVVRGAATLLLESHSELGPERVGEMLRLIDASAEEMGERIEDLVAAGQVESGQVRIDIRSVPVDEILARAAGWARARRLGLEIEPPGEEGLAVLADPERASQILRQFLANAQRHAAGSAVRLQVRATKRNVRFTIRDSGPGVGPADHLFERFGAGSTSRPGAGLGLFLARELARALGGDAGVDRAREAGSSFWFTLVRDV